MQVIGDNCFDVKFEFQIDAFTETGGAVGAISAPDPVRRNPFRGCHKGAAVPLLKRGPILQVFVIICFLGSWGGRASGRLHHGLETPRGKLKPPRGTSNCLSVLLGSGVPIGIHMEIAEFL